MPPKKRQTKGCKTISPMVKPSTPADVVSKSRKRARTVVSSTPVAAVAAENMRHDCRGGHNSGGGRKNGDGDRMEDGSPWYSKFTRGDPSYDRYMEEEWGFETRDDTALFEMLVRWPRFEPKSPAFRTADATPTARDAVHCPHFASSRHCLCLRSTSTRTNVSHRFAGMMLIQHPSRQASSSFRPHTMHTFAHTHPHAPTLAYLDATDSMNARVVQYTPITPAIFR